MGFLLGETAFEHLMAGASEWGSGARGFGNRFGSALASRMVRNTVELGAAGIFGEDYRFRASGQKVFLRRIGYASLSPLLDSGRRRRPAKSRAIATGAGVLFSALCRRQQVSGGWYGREMALGYLGHLQNSLLTEFENDLKAFGKGLLRRLTGQAGRIATGTGNNDAGAP
jgi:hypothetical protein